MIARLWSRTGTLSRRRMVVVLLLLGVLAGLTFDTFTVAAYLLWGLA